jgi:hypothetical protein
MRRRLISWSGFALALVSLALQPARAGDRRSAEPKASASIQMALAAPATPMRTYSERAHGRFEETSGFFTANAPTTKFWQAGGKVLATEDEHKESAPTPPRERKSLTFFRFDSKLGDVSVQPVIGALKGAQLSLGF